MAVLDLKAGSDWKIYWKKTWKKIPGSNWDLNQGLRYSRPMLLPSELLEPTM